MLSLGMHFRKEREKEEKERLKAKKKKEEAAAQRLAQVQADQQQQRPDDYEYFDQEGEKVEEFEEENNIEESSEADQLDQIPLGRVESAANKKGNPGGSRPSSQQVGTGQQGRNSICSGGPPGRSDPNGQGSNCRPQVYGQSGPNR